jgi:hypothetical protein
VADCDGEPGGAVVVACTGSLGGFETGAEPPASRKYPTPPSTARPATPAPTNTGNLDELACCPPVLAAPAAGDAIDAASADAEISTGLGCCAPGPGDREAMTIVASLFSSAESTSTAGAAAAALIAAMKSAAEA